MVKEKDIQTWEIYENILEQYIQAIGKNMSLFGISPSVGRLFGVLYFSDHAMTLDEMGQALSMSKTSMSTGVRMLSDLKMVELIHKKGIRKDLYQTEEDWYKSFTSYFGTRWRLKTETNLDETIEAIDKLMVLLERTNDQELKEKINKDIEKLNYAKSYYVWLMKFIKVVESGEIFQYIPKDHSK
ncbi:GbsR/MarR family transcriptional regulator [Caldibacillus thermolactis]|uniref:HTH-type transcriptional regulator n=1 Tax=Pallidibacillus thermolactis TaxID=251051 RepID=A0ABT2WH75_9BACI|nr:GbsR/MarR family transcriptional regulator [Pallidibacillus thermolactis]MCU9594777.1 GbsR/MarR family transcriptional regulator [Pallidibacillus thermolactis]MCU9601463.1 GbsR/MarR family transcriptional regulator [Pallidibacillus thermolactis subsp. kokeshiiformis]MED1674979.1 GbsR/MarR family transcriptional regulator [Pallidibacillus thermolactis subsp. kokeshiiformis]